MRRCLSLHGILVFVIHRTNAFASLSVRRIASHRSLLPFRGDDAFLPEPGSLSDQTIVVTGGTTGMGLESVKRLAAGGASVILTARSEPKGVAAVEQVTKFLTERKLANANVTYKVVDFDWLSIIREVPQTWADIDKVDVLLNNAGIMALPKCEYTADGYERQIQSNHLGHFALTALLSPKLTPRARIINVASSAHQFASRTGLLSQNALWRPHPLDYAPWTAYGQSKLANILFTQELQRRALAAGREWTAVSLHPGVVNTDLGRYIFGQGTADKEESSIVNNILGTAASTLASLVFKSIPEGADTQIWLAARADIGTNQYDVRGKYLVDRKIKDLDTFATDQTAASRLWVESEEKSGVKFDI